MPSPAFKKNDILIPKKCQYPDGAIRVSTFESSVLTAYPEGGGFALVFNAADIKKYAFRVVSEEEIRGSGYRKSKFGIDGERPGYEGWTNDRRWNGWHSVLFEKAEMCRLVRSWKGKFDEKTNTATFEGSEDRIEGELNEKLGVMVWDMNGYCFEEVRKE